MRLSTNEFEDLVVEALDSLPQDLLEVLDNVDVTIERFPSPRQLRSVGVTRGTLLGLYEGVPLTKRTSGYNIVAPDKITIFQGPIEQMCGTYAAIVEQVRVTVIHEVAHHFGIDDERLVELGWY
jgi:predicted Zn-dependent protease with MMP-like domain